MADTTTAHLSLTKMQAGTHRDNWGDVANDNLDKIDAAVKATRDTVAAARAVADAALPKAGGTVTGDVLRDGAGAHFHWTADGMDKGRATLAPSTGTDPTQAPGDIWFGYTP